MPRFIQDRRHTAVPSRAKNARHPLEGAIFDGVVRDVANNGKGVVEHESGVLVFAAGVWTGERVRIKITAIRKNIAQGQMLEILEPSEHRIAPTCEHFTAEPACGGCAWLFVDYPAQLAAKQGWVDTAFARLTQKKKHSVKHFAVSNIAGSAMQWGYRNRAEFKSDGQQLGYMASKSSELIDVSNCQVLAPRVAEHLQTLRAQLPNREWASAPVRGSKGGRRAKGSRPQYTLIAADSDMSAEQIRVNQRLDFRQTNDAQNEQLKAWLRSVLGHCNTESPLLELFSGAGNFTEVIVELGFAQVVAAELSTSAIVALNERKLPSVQGVVVNLFDEAELVKLCKENFSAKTLVLDPPREGLQCIEPILKQDNLTDIAYISCDLATCARDCERFLEAGYKVASVLPVDMFPQTPHVELCVHLVRA